MGPVQISSLGTYLDLLRLKGELSVFQIKYKAKRFLAKLFPAPRTPVLYPLSRIAEIFTLVGPHGLPHSNSPEDISPPFL